MAKKRVTRKQLLKEPDEFITTAGKLINWAQTNTKQLIIGGGIFFGVVVFISFYSYFQHLRTNTAEALLGQVVSEYEAEIKNKDASTALEKSRKDLDTLVESYRSLPAGKLGAVLYGHACLAGHAYDDAITHYQRALTYFGAESSLRNVILNGLATAYQQKGDYPQAVTYFSQIAAGSSPVLKDTALFNLGRLHDQLGQTDASREAYQKLGSEFPQSIYADVVKEKVAG